VASTTLLKKNARMTSMSFDGSKPLDAGISKRLPIFCGIEKLHTSKMNSWKDDDHHIGYKLKFFTKKKTPK
jgi:hypothetical protein